MLECLIYTDVFYLYFQIQIGCIFDREIIDKAFQILKENSSNLIDTRSIQKRVALKGELCFKHHCLLQQVNFLVL